MEVTKGGLTDRLQSIFLKEPVPFSGRREVNWKAVKYSLLGTIGLAVFVLLLLPAPNPEVASFQDKGEVNSGVNQTSEANPTAETAAQLESARMNLNAVPRSLQHLYSSSQGGPSSGTSRDRNSSMIVTRGGLDLKTQVPPGSRIRVRLLSNATVANQSMPVIGIVTSDFVHEDSVAISSGSKVFGEVSFDGSDRAQVTWKAVQMPDGRERAFSAVSVSKDGQVGVAGKVHSDAVKNTVGQTLTRFIGAYAEGSMQRGALGGNPGGSENGWKNAFAETAKDRAEALAEDMKKERRWIEIGPELEFYAVLTSPFIFREPGGSY